ncbi:hypothetical protein BCD67_07860 [Oscillatoriales cyanobacterium USR001]|nr:hypothetical protein BCD67_07860 [Oscillatoriales cyanobacterium USR001]
MLKTKLQQIGEFNPQLFREIKGRFNVRNIALSVGISLFGQLLLMMYHFAQLPVPMSTANRYCTGSNVDQYYRNPGCLILNGNFVIDWQQWWLDIFIWISFLGMFALLTAGTFMLISDLEKEERRGTLNFIRLTPQSSQTIFIGKLLGVPSLLYLAATLAFPLHLWSGINAQIPLHLILTLDGLVIAASIFTYSLALLFGLVSSWLGGFQPWLGTGTVLFSLVILSVKPITKDGLDLLNLFSPMTIISYLVPDKFVVTQRIFDSYYVKSQLSDLQDWQWFGIPLGESSLSLTAFTLLNYVLWTALIWQALKRYFRNPTTAISKKQSYLITGYLTILTLGFMTTNYHTSISSLNVLAIAIVLFFSFLIAALSPHRQTLQDWARYRQERSKIGVKYSLIRDLVWGENSPAVEAIAVNLLIVLAILIPATLIFAEASEQHRIILALFYAVSFILICASIAQLMLLMKSPKRAFWAGGTVAALIILPPMVLGMLSIYAGKTGASLWLLTPFALDAIQYASTSLIVSTLLGQFAFFGFLNFQLTRQLKKAGESASKALLKS